MIYFAVLQCILLSSMDSFWKGVYLVTIETLKARVVFPLIVSSCPLELLGRLRLLVDFLLEVGLTYSSLGMGG